MNNSLWISCKYELWFCGTVTNLILTNVLVNAQANMSTCINPIETLESAETQDFLLSFFLHSTNISWLNTPSLMHDLKGTLMAAGICKHRLLSMQEHTK